MRDPNYLSARETAARLGVHENTVRNWVREGILASARLPGTRNHRFDERDVERLREHRGAEVASVEPERRAIGPELVNAGDLALWAATRDAQDRFPELVRRLLASTPGVTNVSVRAGEGVALAGWDGRADSTGAAFLPPGTLWFEFGVGGGPKGKADADFAKRREDPKGAIPRESVFVFVTPRRWAGAPDWAAARRAEGVFSDVRVLDADDLEGWLQATPAIHQWISEELGRQPRNAETLEMWWSRFSSQTVPPLPSKLFLAGRMKQREQLAEFFGGPPDVLTIQTRWRDDAIAFTYATIEAVGADQVQPPLVVSAPDVWDRAIRQPGRMTLLPLFQDPDITTARERGHYIVLPVGREHLVRDKHLELPLPHRREAGEALQEAGIDAERAYRLSALVRRNMPSLIRALARDPRLRRPPWSRPPASEIFAPLALIGAWTPSDEDREVVRRITSANWDRAERALRYWLATDDPPFVLSGTQWHVASPEEAFLVLRDALTVDDIERWHRAAIEIILEPDPRLDLPADEQAMAGIRGVGRKNSEVLRQGIAEALAVIGSSEVEPMPDGTTGADRAAAVVENVLAQANADESGRVWQSLHDVMPLLAEAAPEVFLDAVNEDLDRGLPVLRGMFQDGDETSWLYSSSPHTGLLWALEALCWSADSVLSATLALARLEVVDPGGRLANRPIESLRNVLVGWIRHTAAPLSLRVQALEAICRETPDVGWSLTLGLWPETHGVSSPPHSPRFRDWGPDSRTVSIAEWIEYIGHLVRLAIALAGSRVERWAELAARVGALPPKERTRVIEALELFAAPESLAPDERLVLWERLHTEVARQRRFADAEWSMDEAPLSRLEALAARLEPSGDVERFAYLFDWHPDLPDVDLHDHTGYEDKLLSMRIEAVKEALVNDGLEGLRRLAARSAVPSHVGWTAGMVAQEKFTADLLQWLDAPEEDLRAMAAGWASKKLLDYGASWLHGALANPSMTVEARRVALVREAPALRDIWATLDEIDERLADAYWEWMNPWRVPAADAEYATRRLLARGRAWAAVDLLASEKHGKSGESSTVTPALVEEVLDAAIASDPASARTQSLGYELGLLLDYLDAEGADGATLARYELLFFRLLERHRRPRALFAAMSRDPTLFIDFVQRVYRGKNEPKRQLDEGERALAHHAWWILHHWHDLPGRREDGTVDAEHLTSWVREAREAFAESDRADIGDEEIGRVLAASPSGSDDGWPAEPVRDLLETIGSTRIEGGFHVGVMNARGVTGRDVYAGGEQERELAARYRAWARDMARWRRTSRVLRRLAEAYERDARRMDEEAQITADTE
jgi:excisionase family DNA binding protein